MTVPIWFTNRTADQNRVHTVLRLSRSLSTSADPKYETRTIDDLLSESESKELDDDLKDYNRKRQAAEATSDQLRFC